MTVHDVAKLPHGTGAAAKRAHFQIVKDASKLRGLDGLAVVMLDPKYAVNVATMIRNCACFGIEYLFVTGERFEIPTGAKGDRLPRQERLRSYATVQVIQTDFPLVSFKTKTPVIGVELVPGAMLLPQLEHPPNGVYVLGPEDGSIPKGWRAVCHQIVRIPSTHCLNVAQAGGIVLYDRAVSRWRQGDPFPQLQGRGIL